jgi:hypothetical protein
MKKIFLILISIVTIVACKKKESNEAEGTKEISSEKTYKQKDGLTLVKGEFIYFENAAVLQTPKQMFGVVIDDKMQELNEMASSFKKEATDFVQVEIRGKITPRPESEVGWDYRIEIKEILNVSKANSERSEIIKLGKE